VTRLLRIVIMRVKPFLKWAGGKRLLLGEILPLAEIASTGRYFEPFLGSGALFFALEPENAYLSDANAELIEVFAAVKDDVEGVIGRLARMVPSEERYYEIRRSRPRSATGKAARFIYLNKTCFNGLYRVNKDGEFNVPYGRHSAQLAVCDREQLRAASAALAAAELHSGDFAEACAVAQETDFVYFDPPYTTAHKNNGFVEYNAKVFSWRDQQRLAETVRELVHRGVNVMVSNADHPSITRLYGRVPGVRFIKIDRWNTMAGDARKRFFGSELVAVAGAGFRKDVTRAER
jgi:DNA adenine methylase